MSTSKKIAPPSATSGEYDAKKSEVVRDSRSWETAVMMFAGVALTGSLVYGMKGALAGSSTASNKGMAMRVGFQALAIAALGGVVAKRSYDENK